MSKAKYVIVVAIDYCEPSEFAFEKAADEEETVLHVLHVCLGETSAF